MIPMTFGQTEGIGGGPSGIPDWGATKGIWVIAVSLLLAFLFTLPH
jgi:hypothetical protein